jgi:lipid-A-disaccharide synthase-like uncharacterized protein
MHIVLVLALAVLYIATHILNGWLFDFATISDNISLIYLPAFLRLFNLLVLGPAFGTVATILGGLLLLSHFDDPLEVGLLNIACSSAGPLIALLCFRIYMKRQPEISSLQDLTGLTLLYCISNSVIHHVTWVLIKESQAFEVAEVFWMFLGDLNGALLGAYLMKAILDYLEKKGIHFSGPSRTKR